MKRCVAWLLFACCVGASASNAADEKSTLSVITVDKMHCKGCAKRIANHVQKVADVEKIESNVEKKQLIVTPKANKQLSPRALWEAVESAKVKPVELRGPDGVFTEKPAK